MFYRRNPVVHVYLIECSPFSLPVPTHSPKSLRILGTRLALLGKMIPAITVVQGSCHVILPIEFKDQITTQVEVQSSSSLSI